MKILLVTLITFSSLFATSPESWQARRNGFNAKEIMGSRVFIPKPGDKVVSTNDSQGVTSSTTLGVSNLPHSDTRVPETRLNRSSVLEREGSRVMNEEGTIANRVYRSHIEKPYFEITPNSQMVSNANKALADPRSILHANQQTETTYDYDLFDCEESKPATEYTCSRTLIDMKVAITPAEYREYWCTSGSHPNPDDPRCKSRKYYNPPKLYKPEKVDVGELAWTSNCNEFEEMEKQGVCRKVGPAVCPRGEETRMITSHYDSEGKPVARAITMPCWRWEQKYECSYPCSNTCKQYRNRGCEQVGSKCKVKKGSFCVVSENRFRCQKGGSRKTRVVNLSDKKMALPDVVGGESLGGLDEARARLSEPFVKNEDANAEMSDALVRLAVIERINSAVVRGREEARANALEKEQAELSGLPYQSSHEDKDLERTDPNQVDPNSVRVFTGKRCGCNKGFAKYRECCDGDDGWLQRCSKGEQKLAKDKKKGLCIKFADSECVSWAGPLCLRKQNKYCCYKSKMAKIIHEQVHQQLGRPVKDCSGFTVEELSRIDFSQVDFKDLHKEVLEKMKPDAARSLQSTTSRNLRNMVATTSPISPDRRGVM